MRNKYYSGMPQDKYSGIHDGESHRTIPANYVVFRSPDPVLARIPKLAASERKERKAIPMNGNLCKSPVAAIYERRSGVK
jgi:hypothetical protein